VRQAGPDVKVLSQNAVLEMQELSLLRLSNTKVLQNAMHRSLAC
jgi:hypothetical protein